MYLQASLLSLQELRLLILQVEVREELLEETAGRLVEAVVSIVPGR